MIIQCDACQTRFKLADEKLKPEGVKVRCTKCETIFLVPGSKPEPEPAPAPAPEETGSEKQAGNEFDFSDINLDNLSDEKTTGQDDFDFTEFNMEAVDNNVAADAALATPPTAEQLQKKEVKDIGSDLPDFNLPEDFSFDEATNNSEPLADFSPEDLSLESAPSDKTAEPEAIAAEPDQFSAEDLSNPPAESFSFDEGEHPIGGDLGQTFDVEEGMDDLPELGERPEPKVEDFGGGTSDEFNFAEEEVPVSPAEKSAAESSTDSVEFSFDTPAPQVEDTVDLERNTQEAKDFIFEEEPVKPASPQAKPAARTPVEKTAAPRPPSGPPKGRKSGSTRVKKRKKNKHTGLLLMLLLIALLAGGYTYLAQLKGTWDPQILLRHLQQLAGTKAPEDPTANIELVNLRSSFVSNQNSGQLFTISGEARNNYSHTRSAISVKGMIYAPSGQVVMQQTVFCGNPLDEAALRTLPFAKIEESMNNQFGDSLSNLDVAPGQTVPFTVVFKNLPDAVTEFNVEVADSRPGTR